MLTETITWHPVADGLPDAELTVNVATESCEEPVWLGCFDGEVWRDTEGMEIKVTHWAEMLRGPAALPAGVTNWSDLSRPEVLDAHVACYAMGIVPPFMPTPAGVKGLVMADGSSLLDYLNVGDDPPNTDEWTKGFHEARRRLHRILAPQLTSGVLASVPVAWLVPMLNDKPRLFTDLGEARAFCSKQNGMTYPQPLIVAPGYPYRNAGVAPCDGGKAK